MDEIGAFEAKNTLGTLLDRVESGEEIVITRHGKAVARLVPNKRRVDSDQTRRTLERIRQRARALQQSGSQRISFDWPAIKKLRDQGRP